MLYDQSCGRFVKNIKRRKQSKVIDNIAKKYGHEVIRLLPYHCDLNAIELIWADEKDCVARENREMTVKSVEALFRERRSQITAEKCKKCINHVKKVELSYRKKDRIIDQKMDKLEIALDANEDESDIETDSASDEDEQHAKLTKPVYFYVYLLFLLPSP